LACISAEQKEKLVDGALDLHTFRPGEVKRLLVDYLDECRNRGVLEVRIIHGKGTGAMRRTVHAVLQRQTEILELGLGGTDAGAWGATLVRLRPRDA